MLGPILRPFLPSVAARSWPAARRLCLPCLAGAGVAGTGLAGAAGCGSRTSPVVISEFVASNTSGLRDVDGETSDWIELHNRGTAEVDLEGWCLTDDREQLDRWCFPSVTLPAQGYLLVFASGKSGSGTDTQLHASFKLKASEDFLALVRPGGAIAQAFAPYPDQRENVAFGLTPGGTLGFLESPTPGAANR